MPQIDVCQLKGLVPLALKRRAFAVLALQGQPYSRWLTQQLEDFVQHPPLPREGEHDDEASQEVANAAE